MYRKMRLILNPCAGRMESKHRLFDLVEVFSKNGYEVTVNPTQHRLDATEIVKESVGRYELVVCCGGDGTLSEVITGLMSLSEKPLLGYIPAGTTNDLANSLHLPKRTMKAARAIISGQPYPLDIGSFNDRYFSYIATFGAFTEVSYMTPQEMKNTLGHLAYILEAFKHLAGMKTYHLKIEHDGGVLEGDYVFGAVTNSTSVAGLLKLSDNDVKMDDGLFEVLLILAPKSSVEFNKIIKGLLKQKYDVEYVTFFHTSKIKITCESDVSWCLDGEDGGLCKEAVIMNNQKAVTLLR